LISDAEDHVGSTSLTRPSSSVAPLSNRGNIKASEWSTSARAKQAGRLKLAPIAPGDRLRTPNVVNFLKYSFVQTQMPSYVRARTANYCFFHFCPFCSFFSAALSSVRPSVVPKG